MALTYLPSFGAIRSGMITLVLLTGLLAFQPVQGQTDTETPETTEQSDGKKKNKKEKKEKVKKEKAHKAHKGRKRTLSEAQADNAAKGNTPSSDDSLSAKIEHIQDTTVSVLDTTDTHAAWLCARYKKGKMYYIDKNYFGIKIKRKRKKEIWYNLTTDNKLTFKINWESNCHYRLTFLKSKKPTRFRKGTDIGCKITACIEDYYDCVCDVNAIMQYVSVQKDPTNAEVKLKAKQEKAKLEAEEKEARLAEQRVKFGDVGEEGEETEGDGEAGEEGDAKRTGDADGDGEGTDEEGGKEKKEKKEKEPKEKKEKKPKEKKEKAPKEKKEKKEKEPKEKKKKDKEDDE